MSPHGLGVDDKESERRGSELPLGIRTLGVVLHLVPGALEVCAHYDVTTSLFMPLPGALKVCVQHNVTAS